MKELRKFIKDQLSVWPLAAANFRALKGVRTKTLEVGGLACRVQFNPSRAASSTADTSPEAIAARPCFLCAANRPAEQFHIGFEGRKGRLYNVQVNPFPIFPQHLVIARAEHIPQAIWHHFPDMMDFSRRYPDWTVFYNGPCSGASAPDHLHFQAAPRGLMPLELAVDAFLDSPGAPMASNKDATLYHYPHYTRGVFALKATTAKSLSKLFYRLLCCCSAAEMKDEPPFNLYTWYAGGEYRTLVVLRGAVRSHHYFSDGPDHLSISPGAADMAGVFVAPFESDFEKVSAEMLSEMLSEVSVPAGLEAMVIRRLTRTQPVVEVGIMSGREIGFEIISDGAGPQKVSWCDGRIAYNGMLYDELVFDSITRSTLFAEPTFILRDVTIGIGFHWQRRRTMKFAGSLRFIVEGDVVTAVNRIGVEDYLLSVISSEMKSTAGLELLKAHAVISRSWVLSRIRDREKWINGTGVREALTVDSGTRGRDSEALTVDSGTRGRDSDIRVNNNDVKHTMFDVCADDCCQRYQGLTMAAGPRVREAIDATWGEVLEYGGELCDARYSKCCGGVSERFGTCWDGPDVPYLQPVEDRPAPGARDFCDCENAAVLSQVLNDYDLETRDFYRWEVRYTRDSLTDILRRKAGVDIGPVSALEPLERGDSGRICRLRISGPAGSVEIGKELAIRKALSESCLKSSAFEVEWQGDEVVLRGRGWGHGVGLCQIGAAVMAEEGYGYRQILTHYYRGTEIG